MPISSQKANVGISDLLKASWMRTSIKLALLLTAAGLIVPSVYAYYSLWKEV
jgi:hypothetical protein